MKVAGFKMRVKPLQAMLQCKVGTEQSAHRLYIKRRKFSEKVSYTSG